MCNACFKDVSGFRYSCKKCNFDMHVQCTQRREEVIHHFTHEHPLAIVDDKEDLEVQCDICEKPCSDSSDSSCYGCEECDFFLHTSCMINIPPQVNHFFHPSGPLILVTLPWIYRCDGCDQEYYGSHGVFHCGKCEFNLGVECALLPIVESKGADKIQHYAHGHPLALRESKEFDNEVGCRACGENCSGLCFVCERYNCNFFLHRQCVVEFPLETEIHHPFHPPHPLTLDLDHYIFPCRIWEQGIYRFMQAYHCAKCDFNLLIDCAKPPPENIIFKYDGHEHFFLRFIAEIPCVKFELLPSLITSEGQSTVDCRAIPKDEENSVLEDKIAEVNNEIAALTAKEKPLEEEIEKHRAVLERLEKELTPIKQGLERLKKVHLRFINQLNVNMNENKHPN
ncbi:hypothetical protein DITRI_Ditri17bG0120900 [Diplodiscus trichospermus]